MREDAQLLYGFNHEQERMLFRELIKINGIGPKLALVILSGVSATEFLHIIEQDNASALSNLPGIGKKTAERLLLEMRDRLKQVSLTTGNRAQPTKTANIPALANEVTTNAISALVSLGYKPQEASCLVLDALEPGLNCEALILKALRNASQKTRIV